MGDAPTPWASSLYVLTPPHSPAFVSLLDSSGSYFCVFWGALSCRQWEAGVAVGWPLMLENRKLVATAAHLFSHILWGHTEHR